MRRFLLTFFVLACCCLARAMSYEDMPQRKQNQTFTGDIIPRHYKGLGFKEIMDNTRDNLRERGVTVGYHSGQYLNSTYGKLEEVGRVKQLYGISIGISFYSIYPFAISGEYSRHIDNIGGTEFEQRSLSAFLSLVSFPWFYSDRISILPNVGIGVQYSHIPQINNKIVQPVYKMGIIINFPISNLSDNSIQIIGNYYRSLNVTNQPHAMNAITIGLGFSWE